MSYSLADNLQQRLEQLQLLPNEALAAKLLAYLQLLSDWNKVFNLSAINCPDEMLDKHIVDSLLIAPYLSGRRFIDVGSGAGLPGIVLACALPDKQFVLLDSSLKKTRFLVQTKIKLHLENVEVVQQRVELFQPEQGFDGILSRAFAQLVKMRQLTEHLVNPQGRWYAMKGRYPSDEIAALAKSNKVEVVALAYPKADVQRHLVILQS